jgi:uncharacterized protein YceK
MQKLSLILTIILILSGCSAVRKQSRTVKNPEKKTVTELSEIINANITKNNFVIQKASINIVNDGQEKKLLGTLKFRNTGTYLFSIKSNAGIEAARVLITNDTVLVNDRINRKFFYGSQEILAGKYGISFSMLPLILGDYVDFQEEREEKLVCKNGIGMIDFHDNEKNISYEIDCNIGKIIKAIILENAGTEGIKIGMSKFIISEGLSYPGVIVLEDMKKETVITLKIEKIRISEEENINFIPGNNYDKILLK